MKKVLFLFLTISSLIGCQPNSSSDKVANEKAPTESPKKEGLCNSQQHCFSEQSLNLLRTQALLLFERMKRQLTDKELSEENIIRLQAIALATGYEKNYSKSLLDEDFDFFQNLYTKIYNKE